MPFIFVQSNQRKYEIEGFVLSWDDSYIKWSYASIGSMMRMMVQQKICKRLKRIEPYLRSCMILDVVCDCNGVCEMEKRVG